MTATPDPVRERVEATLHKLVDTATAIPCEAVRRMRRSLGEPVAFARTLANLTLSGVFGRSLDGEPDAPVRRTTPADGDDIGAAAAPGADPSTTDPPFPSPLAIEDYENLAASNIVARLDRLDRDELEGIKDFELANRGRRTVVGKIDQLLRDR
jgi:hypothetical protein